jgi:hypothetical protein
VQYLMMIKADPDFEAGRPPNMQLMAGMGQLTEEMIRCGVLIMSQGLTPSSQGVRITLTSGERITTDGPFAETKELIGGFAILRADNKQQAIALANRAIDVHERAGVKDVQIEIRPILEFGPPPTRG